MYYKVLTATLVCVWRELLSCLCRHVETQRYKIAPSNRSVVCGRPREEERMSIAEPVRSPEDWKSKVSRSCDLMSLPVVSGPWTWETSSRAGSNRRHLYFHSPEKFSFMPHIYLLRHFFVLTVTQTSIRHNSHSPKCPTSTGKATVTELG